MTVSTAKILKDTFQQGQALGAKAISSDFAFEIQGYESMWLLASQAPWPVLSPQGEIESPGPLGSMSYQPQQVKTAFQGQVSLSETVAGSVDSMLLDILTKGGTFEAKVYEGTPQKYLRAKKLTKCFLVMDAADRDFENRTQILKFSGTLFYHYFGDDIQGNSTDYR